MTGAQGNRPSLSIASFRDFYDSRPDEQHWELIDGHPVMMTPPTKMHQRIASNLQRLLLDALERHSPALTAYQRVGVNIAPHVDNYDPEPDVVVVDAAIESFEDRYSDRFLPRGGCHVAQRQSVNRVETAYLQAQRGLHVHSDPASRTCRGTHRFAHRHRVAANHSAKSEG